MPRKKTTSDEEQNPEPAGSTDKELTEITQTQAAIPSSPEVEPVAGDPAQNSTVDEKTNPLSKNPWLFISIAMITGLVLGLVLGYALLTRPLQDQLTFTTSLHTDGVTSSNQIKSDLSNTRLRQQEMEIRYLKALAQLEIANQYISLLRMKEQVAIAQLMVEQKKGVEARQSLAEIKTLFDHIDPYIVEKDKKSAEELESLIQVAIQDLTNDPESTIKDLGDIASEIGYS